MLSFTRPSIGASAPLDSSLSDHEGHLLFRGVRARSPFLGIRDSFRTRVNFCSLHSKRSISDLQIGRSTARKLRPEQPQLVFNASL